MSVIVAREGGGRVAQTLLVVCGRAGCPWSIEGPTGEVFADRDAHRLKAHGIVTAGRVRRRWQPSILGRLSAGDHNRAMGERGARGREAASIEELLDVAVEPFADELDAEPVLVCVEEISAVEGGS